MWRESGDPEGSDILRLGVSTQILICGKKNGSLGSWNINMYYGKEQLHIDEKCTDEKEKKERKIG